MALGGDYGDPGGGALGGPPARPGILGYLVAAGLLLSGCLAGGVWAWLGVSSAAGGFRSFAAPGTGTVSLDKPGAWTVFAERTGAKPSRAHFDDCQVTVTAPDGSAVVVVRGGNETYNINQTHGVAIRSFDAPAPGDYTIDVQWPDGADGGPFTAALAHNLVGGILVGVFGGCGLAAITTLLAIIAAVVTFLRRRTDPHHSGP